VKIDENEIEEIIYQIINIKIPNDLNYLDGILIDISKIEGEVRH
jgi:hypothetical protein